MLELKEISFYANERKILENVTYKFEEGKSYAILGNNGVGKSSLSKIIMGLEGYKDKHGGILLFNNIDITKMSVSERAKLGISMAWQEPVRFEGIGVKDYLTLGGKYKKTEKELNAILKEVGLNPFYLHRNVDKTLSGGERKRIEMASILILKPKLVILDEPDSGIDMMSNAIIENVIKKIKESGGTTISITHREEIALIADKALLLCGGKVHKEGNPEVVSFVYKSMCDTCSHINAPIEDVEVNLK